jgi:AAA+ superfamily predicted ATPase
MLDSFRGAAITIAATNHEKLLDTALWRRFDEVVMFQPPNESEIAELLERYLRQIGTEGIDLHISAKMLLESSHADVKRVAEDAIKFCLLSDSPRVNADLLNKAISLQKERLTLRQELN